MMEGSVKQSIRREVSPGIKAFFTEFVHGEEITEEYRWVNYSK
jgi:hypothetical protein